MSAPWVSSNALRIASLACVLGWVCSCEAEPPPRKHAPVEQSANSLAAREVGPIPTPPTTEGWPSYVQAVFPATTLAAGWVHVETFLKGLEQSRDALEMLATRYDVQSLDTAWLDVAWWEAHGFDTSAQMFFAISSPSSVDLVTPGDVEGAAVLVQEAVNAVRTADDREAAIEAQRANFGGMQPLTWTLRLALPTTNLESARAWLQAELGTSKAGRIELGLGTVADIGSHDDVLILDVAMVLGDMRTAGSLDAAHAALDARTTVPPTMPSVDTGSARVFAVLSPSLLSHVAFLEQLLTFGSSGLDLLADSKPELVEATASRVLELLSNLKQSLKVTHALVGQSPVSAVTLASHDLRAWSLDVWLDATAKALAKGDALRTRLDHDQEHLRVDWSMAWSQAGEVWNDAGLGHHREVTLEALDDALYGYTAAKWLWQPWLMPMWMRALPGLFWHDWLHAASDIMRASELQTGQLFIGKDTSLLLPEWAVTLFADSAQTLQRALACVATDGEQCSGEEIAVENPSSVDAKHVHGGALYYHIRSVESGSWVLVASSSSALRDRLIEASSVTVEAWSSGHVSEAALAGWPLLPPGSQKAWAAFIGPMAWSMEASKHGFHGVLRAASDAPDALATEDWSRMLWPAALELRDLLTRRDDQFLNDNTNSVDNSVDPSTMSDTDSSPQR